MSHEVDFTVPKRDLGKADVEFSIKRDGEKLGELHVSKGSVVWFPRDVSYGHKLSWTEFDGLMKSNGTRNEKR